MFGGIPRKATTEQFNKNILPLLETKCAPFGFGNHGGYSYSCVYSVAGRKGFGGTMHVSAYVSPTGDKIEVSLTHCGEFARLTCNECDIVNPDVSRFS